MTIVTLLLLTFANKSIDSFHIDRCMMTMICGTKGKCPCPVFLIPLKELCNLFKIFPMQMISQAIEGYESYLRKKLQGEEILKALGLWLIENVFCRKLRIRRGSQF
ncbi:hypothetical protein J3R82DRAFT_2050 [Butyriboletus roseoflavus]|nr:hypothetical protein J3R82DRAFT_2050 [Butyriboletus roseoflavus]